MFKWSVTNDETISDQPTESLRELLLFGGTPLLFVENRAMHTFWSQIQQIFTTHIELFALLLKWGVNPDSVKNKRARNNDFLYAWATPLKEVCSQEASSGVLSFEAERER